MLRKEINKRLLSLLLVFIIIVLMIPRQNMQVEAVAPQIIIGGYLICSAVLTLISAIQTLSGIRVGSEDDTINFARQMHAHDPSFLARIMNILDVRDVRDQIGEKWEEGMDAIVNVTWGFIQDAVSEMGNFLSSFVVQSTPNDPETPMQINIPGTVPGHIDFPAFPVEPGRPYLVLWEQDARHPASVGWILGFHDGVFEHWPGAEVSRYWNGMTYSFRTNNTIGPSDATTWRRALFTDTVTLHFATINTISKYVHNYIIYTCSDLAYADGRVYRRAGWCPDWQDGATEGKPAVPLRLKPLNVAVQNGVNAVRQAVAEAAGLVGAGTGSDVIGLDDIPAEKEFGIVLPANPVQLGSMSIADVVVATSTTADPTNPPDPPNNNHRNIPRPKVGLSDVFPFCIPFDFVRAIQSLVAPPTPPKFTMDFSEVEMFGGFVWELDMADFESVARVVRWTVWIGFIVGLMFATRKLMKW